MKQSRFAKDDASASDLARDYLDALQTLSKPNPFFARNLVLDIFAQERAFVRCFQGLIDARLESKTGRHWASAVLAEHGWAFHNMSTLVIDEFKDNWRTSNCMLATLIMQAIAEWLGYMPDASWECYIENHRLSLLPEQPPLDSGKANARRSYETQGNSRTFYPGVSQQSYVARDRQTSVPTNLARSSNLQVRPPTKAKHYASSKPDRSGLAFAGAALFVGVSVGFLFTTGNNTGSNPNQPEQGSSNEYRREPRAPLEAKLNSYKRELQNSRLMCEYASVEQSLQSLSGDS